ncbi:hypothetical protein D3C81_2312040 [compost metagenome]
MPIGPITTSAASAPINSVRVGVNTVFSTSGMKRSTHLWIYFSASTEKITGITLEE